MFQLLPSRVTTLRLHVNRLYATSTVVSSRCVGFPASIYRSYGTNGMCMKMSTVVARQHHLVSIRALSNSGFHSSTLSQQSSSSSSPSQQQQTQQVTAHILGLSINTARLRDDLVSQEARFTERDSFMLVEECSKIGHTEGAVFIGNNGSLVLWHGANATYSAYKDLIENNLMTKIQLPSNTLSDFSESIDIKEGERSCISKGVLYLPKTYTTAEQTAISLALMSAVQLNHMEFSIRVNMMLSNDVLERLRKSVSKKNLDHLAERLFEFQTYAHKTRYWLNLEYDPLEIPDALWDNENLCTLFMTTQATFDMPQRLEKLNHRISWELDSLQSHSEYIRHKHSSRLEKIIIIVITLELALALSQALYKLI